MVTAMSPTSTWADHGLPRHFERGGLVGHDDTDGGGTPVAAGEPHDDGLGRQHAAVAGVEADRRPQQVTGLIGSGGERQAQDLADDEQRGVVDHLGGRRPCGRGDGDVVDGRWADGVAGIGAGEVGASHVDTGGHREGGEHGDHRSCGLEHRSGSLLSSVRMSSRSACKPEP